MRWFGAAVIAAIIQTATLAAAVIPGIRLERIAPTQGFVTSIAVDSGGRIYYSVTNGGIYRVESGNSVQVATVDTATEGNAALLGIALRDDNTIVAHHVAPDMTADLITTIDLVGGTRMTTQLLCNTGRDCSTEHHGGNPVIGPGGAVFVGIGDFGASQVAQQPDSWGGKIVKIVDGTPRVFANGFRNPFDLAIDPMTGKLIVSDNGVVGGDEINIISDGDNAGWPLTMGNDRIVEGTVPPIFTFAETTAPTGLVLLNGTGRFKAGGLLVGSFVTKALYYFPDVNVRPLPKPIEIVRADLGPVIDIAQTPTGDILVANVSAIYRLHLPTPGDADGNGRIEEADLRAISREILDGDGDEAVHAHEGTFRGTWGADANEDGLIDSRDLVTVAKKRNPRSRAVRP